MEEERRDLSSQNFAALVKTLNDQALHLLTSSQSTPKEKIVGLNVMDALLEIHDEDMIRRRRDFGNLLRQFLKTLLNSQTYSLPLLNTLCATLGHFSSIASTTDIEFVQEHFLKPVEDWMKDDRYPVRRVVAVLIIDVLLSNAPALFYSKKNLTFDQIWQAIFDTKERVVRVRAAETLGTFLMFVHQRERTDHFYSRSLEQAEVSMRGAL